ncbi:MAG: tail fiber domain-containing protein, partial [Lentisphaeraceae bacterium]|nr:tail fiber domain-containing protein [Lentisphaeraceae bacterium]
IQADQFYAVSDQRIKSNAKQSQPQQDLEKLLQLQITDYQYHDKVKHGERVSKGLIAQELEEVFPEAVSHGSDFVPDIYAAAVTLNVDEANKELTCTLAKAHGLEVGDLVKLITEDNTEFQKEVVKVIDENTFVVKDYSEKAEKIFVFGKQVDDFRTVDYQQVAMLGVSAVQALHQQVADLKKENASLKELLLTEMKNLRDELGAIKV